MTEETTTLPPITEVSWDDPDELEDLLLKDNANVAVSKTYMARQCQLIVCYKKDTLFDLLTNEGVDYDPNMKSRP